MCEHTHDCECIPPEQVEQIVDARLDERVATTKDDLGELEDEIDEIRDDVGVLRRENERLRRVVHAVETQLPEDSPAKAKLQEVL